MGRVELTSSAALVKNTSADLKLELGWACTGLESERLAKGGRMWRDRTARGVEEEALELEAGMDRRKGDMADQTGRYGGGGRRSERASGGLNANQTRLRQPMDPKASLMGTRSERRATGTLSDVGLN